MPGNHDPKTGQFLTGNNVAEDAQAIRKLQREYGLKFSKRLMLVLSMSPDHFNRWVEDNSRLTMKDVAIITLIRKALDEANPTYFKMLMAQMGVISELKAQAIQVFDNDSSRSLTLEETIYQSRTRDLNNND